MYKSYVCLCLIFLMGLAFKSYAQLKAGTIKAPDGTITTTGPVNDAQLNETWTSEYKNKDGVTTRTVTYKKDLNGKWTFSSEAVTPGGRVTETIEGELDVANGRFRIIKFTRRKLNKSGKPTEQTAGEIGITGQMHIKEGLDNQPKKESDMAPEDLNKMNEKFLYPFIHTAETEVSQNPNGNAVGNASANCGQKFVISLGPSYLNRDFGDETKSALGVHFIANYNINNHIAAGVDLSTYSVKVGDEKLNTSFYLLDGVYTFGKGSQQCPPHISVFGRMMIGMMYEKYVGNSGSGLAYGAGVGANYRVSKNFKIVALVDYIRAEIENEGMQNIRGSVLVTMGFGNTPAQRARF